MLKKILKFFSHDREPSKPRPISRYKEFVAEFKNVANDDGIAAKLLELTRENRISWAPRGWDAIGEVSFRRSLGGKDNYESIKVELEEDKDNHGNLELVVTKRWFVIRFATPIDEGATGTVIRLSREKSSEFASAVRKNIREIWEKKKPERDKEMVREIFSCVE